MKSTSGSRTLPDYSSKTSIPILTGEEAANWDAFTIEEKKVDSRLLMGWAGLSMFQLLSQLKWFSKAKEVHILAGKGNNGGDAYVVAWHLLNASRKKIFIWQMGPAKTKDSQYFYELVKENAPSSRVKIADLQEAPRLQKKVIIDGLFGTGFKGEPDSSLRQIFKKLNRGKNRIVAIDIASGVYASGDIFSHETIKAELTLTFGSYKVGHLVEPGILSSGKTHVFAIGFSQDFTLPARRLAKPLHNQAIRKQGNNKYSSGTIHILGGSPGMEGAAIMTGQSFLKMGGGLAKIYSTSKGIRKYLKDHPELMYNSFNSIEDAAQAFLKSIRGKGPEVAVIGVGLQEKLPIDFWRKLVTQSNLHLVIDGSGLKQLPDVRYLILDHKLKSLVLTPHKGEAEVLDEQIVKNVRECALNIANGYRATVYLKGPGGILVAQNETEIFLKSDHSELATGGTGDVLSGGIANMLVRYPKKRAIRAVEKAVLFYLKMAEKITKRHKDFLSASEIYRYIK